jgi:hypothetical protein
MAMLLAVVVFGLVAQDCDAAGKTLRAFKSETEFAQLLADWKERADDKRKRLGSKPSPMGVPAPPSPAPAGADGATVLDKIELTGSRIEPEQLESITNVQTTGVDEGDIVKRAGDYLVVLRRGRIFTIRIGSDRLEPVSVVNAYAPDADPARTWYDEMLIADGTVVVIGYSYERGGTEIGLFDLGLMGNFAIGPRTRCGATTITRTGITRVA